MHIQNNVLRYIAAIKKPTSVVVSPSPKQALNQLTREKCDTLTHVIEGKILTSELLRYWHRYLVYKTPGSVHP